MSQSGGPMTLTDGGDGAIAAAAPLTDTTTTPVTFVCCVESGALEEQTVRLAASIRRWGGTFAACPMIAVTPRRGAPLQHRTRQAFDDLEVTYIRQHVREPFSWFKYMGKVSALNVAEQYATTDIIVWLDSDILLLDEPYNFRLPDDVSFGACAASRHGGTTGPGDVNEPWWAAVCDAVGVPIDALPWVTTYIDEQRVRLYFNSGVFAYRRSSGLLPVYDACTRRILGERISSHQTGIVFTDQVALPLSVAKLGLRYQSWPQPYNYNVGHGIDHYYSAELMREARVLHYHNYMKGEGWPRLMRMLRETWPTVADWLAQLGPVTEPRLGGPRDLMRSAFKAYRRLRQAWFERALARVY